MRTYPHNPNWTALEALRSELRRDVGADLILLSKIDGRDERVACLRCLTNARELARLEYAFESPMAEIKKLLTYTGKYFLQAPDLDLQFHPQDYADHLSVMVLSGDAVGATLAAQEHSAFIQEGICDERFYRAAEALANLVLGISSDLDRQFLSKTIHEPNNVVSDLLKPILSIQIALLEQNPRALVDAFDMRHKRWIEEASQHRRAQSEALLDIQGLALMKLGQNRGLLSKIDSVYLPEELLS